MKRNIVFIMALVLVLTLTGCEKSATSSSSSTQSSLKGSSVNDSANDSPSTSNPTTNSNSEVSTNSTESSQISESEITNFQFLSNDEDKTSNKLYAFLPDGVPDGHVKITFNTNEEILLRTVMIEAQQDFGGPFEQWGWSLGAGYGEYLKTNLDGQDLTPKGEDEYGKISPRIKPGKHEFDTYFTGIVDNLWDYNASATYKVTIVYITQSSEREEMSANFKTDGFVTD